MESRVDLEGAIDLHAHCGPSLFDRRVDGYEYASEAADAGMDAVVMKAHHLPTAYGVPYIEQLLARDGTSIDVVGSITLNYCNGGFNPFAVDAAIGYGAGVVWGPTLDAKHHGEVLELGGHVFAGGGGEEYEDVDGIDALDENGDLTEDVRLCLRKIADSDVVLCLGHVSYEETRNIVEYAADLGHEKVVVDHPNFPVTGLGVEQQETLVSLGATLNFPFNAISPTYGWVSNEELYENVREVGVDNCVLSSDVGQIPNPSSPESLRLLGEALLEAGLSRAEFHRMVREAPRELLGIGQ
jgi:hypothetical protein